jgi:mercuric ion binding protein
MRVLKVLARKATEAPLLAVVLLTSSIVGADMTDGLQQGEEIVVLNVENMTWLGCVVAVRNSLKKVEGVKNIEVDLDARIATVVVASKEFDTSLLIAATTNIGFPSAVREP